MARITNAGKTLLSASDANETAPGIDTFIWAYIPDLANDAPESADEPWPTDSQIKYQGAPTQKGQVNSDTVVWSSVLGSDRGTFPFNWLGIGNSATKTLVAFTHIPEQTKTATAGTALGDNITKNLAIQYRDLADITGITISAATWQIDWTARLNGIDQREMEDNADIYGRSCFWVDGFKVKAKSGGFELLAGNGYAQGLRIATQKTNITTGTLPKKIWADVALIGGISGKETAVTVVSGTGSKTDYVDDSGAQHYLIALADINAAGQVTDLRRSFDIGTDLISYLSRMATETKPGWNRRATRNEVLNGTGTGVVTAELLEARLAALYGVFPGVMVEFAGRENQIQDGWALCVGQGRTSNGIQIPDRRNRFTVGGGDDYEYGETGGEDSKKTKKAGKHGHGLQIHDAGNHGHGITIYGHALTKNELPRVPLRFYAPNNRGGNGDSDGWNLASHMGIAGEDIGPMRYRTRNNAGTDIIILDGGGQPHGHGGKVHNSGNHSHNSTLDENGEHDHTIDVRPRYYATCYIIKL